MECKVIQSNGKEIAIVKSPEVLIKDVQDALDLMATVKYDTGAYEMVLYKEVITEEFFDLKTKLAGEILQKFINYGVRLAIVGDFSVYSSKSLRDFIYESNHGKDFFFVSTVEEAVEKLSK